MMLVTFLCTWVVATLAENESASYAFHGAKEVTIEKGKLLREFYLPYLGKEFSISFELFINEVTGYPWQSVLHLTTGNTGENRGKMGLEIPTVAVNVYKDLYVIFAISGNDSSKAVGKVKENEWIKVEISQKLADDKYNFEVLLNNKSVWLVENTTPALYNKPRIDVSSPWHPEVDGKIKGLKINSSINHGKLPDEFYSAATYEEFLVKQSVAFRMCESYRGRTSATNILAIQYYRPPGLHWIDGEECKKKLVNLAADKDVYLPTVQNFHDADLNKDWVLTNEEWMRWVSFRKCQSYTDKEDLSWKDVQTCEKHAKQEDFDAADENDDGVLMLEEWLQAGQFQQFNLSMWREQN